MSAGWNRVPGRPADPNEASKGAAAGSRARPPREGWASVSCGAQAGVDLAGDVTLEAADDLFLGQAFFGAAFDVGAGGGMGAHPGDRDPPQGVVGLAVAAGVEAVAGDLAGGCGDRGDRAQVRPGGLGAEPLGVV